jgi:hypothetical protein
MHVRSPAPGCSLSEGPEKTIRGDEYEPNKILCGNVTYVLNRTQHISLLIRSLSHSYSELVVLEIGLVNWKHSKNMNQARKATTEPTTMKTRLTSPHDNFFSLTNILSNTL